MLVLSRRSGESIFVGDEVTITVEDVCKDDGQRIPGMRVKLGFQSPAYVSIQRSELCARRSRDSAGRQGLAACGPSEPTPPRPGKLIELSDVYAKLRIEVPRKIPVDINGTPLCTVSTPVSKAGPSLQNENASAGPVALPEENRPSESDAATVTYRVSFRKEDRVAICHNIVVLAVGFEHFVFQDSRSAHAG